MHGLPVCSHVTGVLTNSLSAQRDVADARRVFWRNHAIVPACGAALLAALFITTDLDRQIAWALAFDAKAQEFVARDAVWANDVLHIAGRNVLLGLAILCAAGWYWCRRNNHAACRRAWGFSLCVSLLAIGIVLIARALTNVDCPWDLQGFGGSRPYVQLFAPRPDTLPHAQCFPGAHSASGFAIFAIYFGFFQLWPRVAQVAWWLAIASGVAFSVAQQARGAHFLSHDLGSAFLTWFVCLSSYALSHRSSIHASYKA